MEKRAVIDENTPPENNEKRAMREDGFYKKILPPIPITNDELDRSVTKAEYEEHLTKRLADKVSRHDKKCGSNDSC